MTTMAAPATQSGSAAQPLVTVTSTHVYFHLSDPRASRAPLYKLKKLDLWRVFRFTEPKPQLKREIEYLQLNDRWNDIGYNWSCLPNLRDWNGDAFCDYLVFGVPLWVQLHVCLRARQLNFATKGADDHPWYSHRDAIPDGFKAPGFSAAELEELRLLWQQIDTLAHAKNNSPPAPPPPTIAEAEAKLQGVLQGVPLAVLQDKQHPNGNFEFDPARMLGSGGFGIVFVARYPLDVAEWNAAFKKIKTVGRPSNNAIALFCREVASMKDVRHPNVSQLLAVCMDPLGYLTIRRDASLADIIYEPDHPALPTLMQPDIRTIRTAT